MNLEVKEDSTYTFRFEKWSGRSPATISAATLRIFSSGGLELKASSSMTIATNVATLAVNFSVDPSPQSYSLGRNYRAEMTIDSVVHNRLFDIVKYPFVNEITDNDLNNEWDGIETLAASKRGETDSGATDRFVDAERGESDGYWDGGVLNIFPLGDVGQCSEHVVTSWTSSSKTMIYAPARATAIVAGQAYTVRRNLSREIIAGGEIVAADLWKKERRIALVLDGTQVSRLIIYKVLERLFGGLIRGTDEEWVPLYERYQNLYEQELASMPLEYDDDEIGAAEHQTGLGSVIMDR